MNNSPSCSKVVFSILVGVAGVSAMASLAQGADVGAPVLERWNTQTAASEPQGAKPAALAPSINQKRASSKGPQGPIRTEFSDQNAKADGELIRSDLQKQRYPMADGVAIP